MEDHREHTFSLPESEIDLEIYWSYSHTDGKYFGRPEDCYPDEEECEVLPPPDIAARVKAHAEKMIPIWIKAIEAQCMDMGLDNMPAEWADEVMKDDDDERAADYYESRRSA